MIEATQFKLEIIIISIKIASGVVTKTKSQYTRLYLMLGVCNSQNSKPSKKTFLIDRVYICLQS